MCVCLSTDFVKTQNDPDALVKEVGLPEQASAIQGHQLLVEVNGEDVHMDPTIQILSLPQCHRTQRSSWRAGETTEKAVSSVNENENSLSMTQLLGFMRNSL